MYLSGKLFVPTLCKKELLKEFHNSRFAAHPGSTKMYRDLVREYKWRGVKHDVADFASKCFICQQVKVEQQRTT